MGRRLATSAAPRRYPAHAMDSPLPRPRPHPRRLRSIRSRRCRRRRLLRDAGHLASRALHRRCCRSGAVLDAQLSLDGFRHARLPSVIGTAGATPAATTDRRRIHRPWLADHVDQRLGARGRADEAELAGEGRHARGLAIGTPWGFASGYVADCCLVACRDCRRLQGRLGGEVRGFGTRCIHNAFVSLGLLSMRAC